MVKFCQSEKEGVAIEAFRDKFNETCSNECQDQSSIFKDPLIGDNSMKMNADAVCLSICNSTRKKLEMFIEGVGLGRSLSEKDSADCSASVTNSGRNVTNKDFDTVIKEVRSSSATQQ